MHQKTATIDSLPDDLREKVEQHVRAGEFATADDAIRQAILSQHERLELRRSIQEADAAFARGEGIPGDQVFDEIRERSAQRRQQ
jgi:Arc/MetJ-type ribon-helix-helix transcriptional regulator